MSDRLDPQVQALLAQFADKPLMHTVPVAIARRGFDRAMVEMVPAGPAVAVSTHTIDGPAGPLAVREYRAPRTGEAEAALPLVVYLHGGGWVVGSLASHDALCRALCARSGAIVLSVDYRLAPEHPFPAGLDDCEAAARWAFAQAPALGADARRVVLAGDSAGGNLAAALTLRLRDAGGPRPAAQVLLYPVTDHYSGAHPSYAAFGRGYGLERETMQWFWDHYLGESAAVPPPPEAAPLRATDLSGLPPALVLTAGHDVLRDEGDAYAQRLAQAGVPTEHACHASMHHGFASWCGVLAQADLAIDRVAAWIAAVRPVSA
jgi:acetyl esterase